MLFLFLLYIVFVAANKPITKRSKTGFILYAPDSPRLNGRVKNKTRFEFFSTVALIASFKNTKQNIRENIVYSVGFTKPALKCCAQITKPPSLIVNCRQNYDTGSVKPIL